MYQRFLIWLSRKIDARLAAIASKGWEPTGKDGDCEPYCDYCGYLCSRCGRPF
jgi:hypothetical protein